jgi:hypothetical protein
MMRVKARWSGFNGAPGWSNFYFNNIDDSFYTPEDAATAVGKVWTFFDTVNIRLPSTVKIDVSPDVEVISPTDGQLQRVNNGGSTGTISGSQAAAPYSASTGMVITWRTAGVRNGRRVRGRTFLVPIAGAAYGNDGTIGDGDVAETLAAANALAQPWTGISLGVWSRPSAVGATDGAWHPIVSASVPDLAAVLRSRRG